MVGFKVFVAGPGIAPGLEDYEPSVRLYTTPHVCFKEQKDYIILRGYPERALASKNTAQIRWLVTAPVTVGDEQGIVLRSIFSQS